MCYFITGIDIGLHNMGIVKCKIVDDKIYSIEHFELIDLYKYKHIYSETELHMFISNLCDEYSELFNSKYILIERQPPGGLIAIQEVIAYIFKDKVYKISPRSVHSKLGISFYSYENRKIKSEEIMKTFLIDNKQHEQLEIYNKLTRKHDVSDAFCLIKYFINHFLYVPIKQKNKINLTYDIDNFFKTFEFMNTKCTLKMVEG